jgi:hypothetical protein
MRDGYHNAFVTPELPMDLQPKQQLACWEMGSRGFWRFQ